MMHREIPEALHAPGHRKSQLFRKREHVGLGAGFPDFVTHYKQRMLGFHQHARGILHR